MKCFSITLTLLIISLLGNAQTAEDSVKAAINDLFIGMRTANVDKIRNAFADSAILQSIAGDKEKGLIVRNESLTAFADLIGRTTAGDADERITFETIRIDGPLAIVWTPYLFYYKGNFSHCGVNSFQLLRIKNQWKIQYLIDTRRKSGCNISAK